jgi:hypothetical protein
MSGWESRKLDSRLFKRLLWSSAHVCNRTMCIFLYVRTTLMVIANIRRGAVLHYNSARLIQSTHGLNVTNSSITFAGHRVVCISRTDFCFPRRYMFRSNSWKNASWVLPPSPLKWRQCVPLDLP